MSTNEEAKRALVILEDMQRKLRASNRLQVDNELSQLIRLLHNPVFRGLLQLQDNLNLKKDVTTTTTNGHHSPTTTFPHLYNEPPHSRHMKNGQDGRASAWSSFEEVEDGGLDFGTASIADMSSYLATVLPAEGRTLHRVQLMKEAGQTLGFSVLGRRSMEGAGTDDGIFIEDIQEGSIAHRNGFIANGDQIVAINGRCIIDPEGAFPHQEAVAILQRACGLIQLVLARYPVLPSQPLPLSASSNLAEPVKMVLSSEWAQVEVIDLHNDGSGLGFAITGGRSTGVVVKSIVPGSVAHRDGRLRLADHILFCNEVSLRGMGSDQVAAVLRQMPDSLRLIVARTLDADTPTMDQDHLPRLRSAEVTDVAKLEQALGITIQAPMEAAVHAGENEHDKENVVEREGLQAQAFVHHRQRSSLASLQQQPLLPTTQPPAFPTSHSAHTDVSSSTSRRQHSLPEQAFPPPEVPPPPLPKKMSVSSEKSVVSAVQWETNQLPPSYSQLASPPFPPPFPLPSSSATTVVDETVSSVDDQGGKEEKEATESFVVELMKDSKGLGITIAGFVGGEDEISGIFIKSIAPGSAADLDGRIRVHDQIIEVDGAHLEGFSNQQAVQKLKNTGQVVTLKLLRHLSGRKHQQLESYFRDEDSPSNGSVSFRETAVAATTKKEENEAEDSMGVQLGGDRETAAGIACRWRKILGSEFSIVVADVMKERVGGGLGISLEGTVDVEGGKDVRPHHYIRSLLPDGPVGLTGQFQAGDELLEVNGQRLLGVSHNECVALLKELPQQLRMVCARRKRGSRWSQAMDTPTPEQVTETAGATTLNVTQMNERLIKAKSDGSLAIASAPPLDFTLLQRSETLGQHGKMMRSRSLEPITQLSMWSDQATVIELNKQERGLGFSILDYQDPLNAEESVIVIRSLVPGGVAQQDGRLVPGDRLLWVNDINLEKASLERAVEILKGASRGIVRIGVAKPLPVLPSLTSQQLTSSHDVGEVSLHHNMDFLNQGDSAHYVSSAFPEKRTYQLVEDYSTLKRISQPSLAAHHIGAMSPSSRTATPVQSPRWSPMASPSLLPGSWASDVPFLPAELERSIRLPTSSESLGLEVDVVDKGINGCLIRDIKAGSAADLDGRLAVGDYLTSINHESLRRVVRAQAHAILRRASLLTSDISVTYIPAAEAAVHRHNFLHQHGRHQHDAISSTSSSRDYSQTEMASLPDQTSPRSPFLAQRSMMSTQETIVEQRSPSASPLPAAHSPSEEAAVDTLSMEDFPPPPPSLLPVAEKEDTAVETTATLSVSVSALRHWAPPRTVLLERQPNRSLGISIVGGKVQMSNGAGTESTITGIFIKQVLPDSPAGREGTLKTGDRILEVDGKDIRESTHEYAVDIIRNAQSPVTFVVQSLISHSPAPPSTAVNPLLPKPPATRSHSIHDTSSLRQTTQDEAAPAQKDASINGHRASIASHQSRQSSKSSSFDRNNGLNREGEEDDDDDSQTDSMSSWDAVEKYGDLGGQILQVTIPRSEAGLGLSLVGNKDRQKMSVFVLVLDDDNPTTKNSGIRPGDELLEVNKMVVRGRSHLNASAMIKTVRDGEYHLTLLRRPGAVHEMAVSPGYKVSDNGLEHGEAPHLAPTSAEPHWPPHPSEDELTMAGHPQIKTAHLFKAANGLGFGVSQGMGTIPEGIYIKTITEDGSAAKEGTLRVDDQIIAVNGVSLVGLPYDEALSTLCVANGNIAITVSRGPPAPPPASTPATTVLPAMPSTRPPPLPLVVQPLLSPSLASRTLSVVEEAQQEVNLEIQRANGLGLGLQLALLPVSIAPIVIREILPAGSVAVDGRLMVGDRLLTINGKDFSKSNDTEAAMDALLQGTDKPIHLRILRDVKTTLQDDDMYQLLEVELAKKAGRGLGLSIIQHQNEKGVFVSEVVKGGESEGKVHAQDQILSVNGYDVRDSSQEDAATLLKTAAMGKVHLKLRRLRPGARSGAKAARRTSSASNEKRPNTAKRATRDTESSSARPAPVPPAEPTIAVAPATQTMTVEFFRQPSEAVGFTVVGSKGQLSIGQIVESALAASLVRTGDTLLRLNDVSLQAMTPSEVNAQLKQLTGKISLLIQRRTLSTPQLNTSANPASAQR
ncbi:hypothetical protein RvY_06126 [Ramazzottius varieornatus]|uniref:Multiple PDZ domain protein n=1 Tax=Ramazzottius varieornatus TaxID=947166 RepID=A0A1D1UXH3_RAMVA|nr:hypothetical protein RvY_06126 [Ramazzottius varieornatus]